MAWSGDHFEAGELQEKLFGTRIAELHRGLLILSYPFHFDDGTDAETLMLDGLPFLKAGGGC